MTCLVDCFLLNELLIILLSLLPPFANMFSLCLCKSLFSFFFVSRLFPVSFLVASSIVCIETKSIALLLVMFVYLKAIDVCKYQVSRRFLSVSSIVITCKT